MRLPSLSRSGLLIMLAAAPMLAQQPPIPVRATVVNGITSSSVVIDNRSPALRSNTTHMFCATGTGVWSVQIQYSDVSYTGPWSNFSDAFSLITSSSSGCSGVGFGLHSFIRFAFTGTASVNYTGVIGFYFPSISNGAVSSVGLSMPPAVFAVTGSPVSTNGTFSVALQSQAANSVFAGPTSGGSGTPGFRALVAADIPSLAYAPSTIGTAVQRGNGSGGLTAATASNVVSLFTGTPTGLKYLRDDGTLASAVNSLFGRTGDILMPITTPDITTPGNPSTGNTTWYTKAGTICALSPTGIETCTGTGTGAFSSITPGTNTNGAMVVGSGSSISATGTGVVDANRILGTTLSGLTGIVRMTLGVPSIATSSNVISLWTGACNAFTYLRGDGTCNAPAGGSSTWDQIGTGTNVGSTFTMGTGGILTYTGSGIINATHLLGTNLTTITGIVKMAAGVPVAAVAGTDYAGPTSGIGVQKGDGAGQLTTATAGTDYSAPAVNETTSGNRTFTGSVTASGATHTIPAKVGAAAGKPSACTIGEMYFATDATAGQNWYYCTVSGNPGTWVQQLNSGGSAGGSNGQVLFNNSGVQGGFTMSGDATLNTATGVLTLKTVVSPGSCGDSSHVCAAIFDANGRTVGYAPTPITGITPYVVTFSGQTTLTIAAASHGFAYAGIEVNCKTSTGDSAQMPNTVNPSTYAVTITPGVAFTGQCTIR